MNKKKEEGEEKEVQETEAERLAKEEKAEMDSFGDFKPDDETPAEEASPEPKPEGDGTEPPQETENEKKLREQIENLNTSMRELRDENKVLKAKKPDPPEKQKIDVDPDVKEAVLAVIEETEAEAAERKATERREEADRMAAEAEEKYGKETFVKYVSGYFGPAMEADEGLLKEFQQAENPAEFAYAKGKELYEADQAGFKESATSEARANTLKELADLGMDLPPSLATVTGSADVPQQKKGREFDDF